MTSPCTVFVGALSVLASGATAQAPAPRQSTIPIRQVAPAEATALESLGSVVGLKQLPDGRVLVNDAARRRLVIFDASLATFTISADANGNGVRSYPQRSTGGFYPYPGDSALFVDMDSRTFILIEPDGTLGRAMSHPKPQDLLNVILQYGGTPGIDWRGRFVYRAGNNYLPPPPAPPGRGFAIPLPTRDTIPIVRADFDTRVIDTIASITVPRVAGIRTTTAPNGKVSGVVTVNPVPAAPDDWAVLSDGSVAIVRAHDYHIDWLYAGGTTGSTPRMPFDWRRLTDEDKQAKIDSARRIIDSVRATGRPYSTTIRFSTTEDGRAKVDTIIPTVEFVPLSGMMDYVPPIRSGALKPDLDANLWILPTTSSQARDGLLYDVVNRKGQVFERVQLPKDRAIAGFGRGGVIYLMWRDGAKGWMLERTKVLRDGTNPGDRSGD